LSHRPKQPSIDNTPPLQRWRATGNLYSTISLTRPAPMVRPPSRIAKRCPFSIATDLFSSIETETLSPGITISTPSGNATLPVTSLVRK